MKNLVQRFFVGIVALFSVGGGLSSVPMLERSTIAGAKPEWGATGHKLFYASSSNSVIDVRWSTDGTRFTHDAGQPYLDLPQEAGSFFGVLSTDESFVVITTLFPGESELRLVPNWTSLLER